MGNKFSLCKDKSDTSVLNTVTSQRECMATWLRSNIAVTDVYEIIKTLGQGRMGEVYHVRRRETGRTHTQESKKKEEEKNLQLSSKHKVDYDLDMDDSIRQGSLNGSIRKGRTSHRRTHSYGDGGSLPSGDRSKSPFRRSGKDKSRIDKKTTETPLLPNNASLEETLSGLEIMQSEIGDGLMRKSPPDLSNAAKPKSILRQSSHVGTSSNHVIEHSSMHSEEKSSGMTALITGKDLMDDDNDEEVPMNINAIGEPKKEGETEATKIEKSSVVIHATFAEPEMDDLSVVSDITTGLKESVITGDGPSNETKHEVNKWVPRRRVYFRRHYACKTIATENIKKDQMIELMNEIYMMRKMDHPYIIKLYEVYQVDRKMWLVMDLCTGGDLNSRKLDERGVTIVAEQILRGVAYLHKRGICHRDLKLENILYESDKKDSAIRLIDFGLSHTYDRIDRNQKFMGAAYTLSPEVLCKQPYTEKSDIWSIGVMIWILLSGDYPFIKKYEDLKNDVVKKKLEQANFSFGITWRGRGISDDAKNFVRGCLKRDPAERWNALQALTFLQDTWLPTVEKKAEEDAEYMRRITPKVTKRMRQDSMMLYTKTKMAPPVTITEKRKNSKIKNKSLFDKDVLIGIKRFASFSLFKKTILVTMANTMDSKDVGEVRDLFLLMDTSTSGTITLPELKEVLEKDETNQMSVEDIEDIFKKIDYDGSGEIHYAEFLAALAESQGLITIDRLEDTFDRIDRNGKGYISHEDLQHIMGGNYKKETVDKMIEEGDFKKNNQIDFDEFLKVMVGDAKEGEKYLNGLSCSSESLGELLGWQ